MVVALSFYAMAITLTNTGNRTDLLLVKGSPFTRVQTFQRNGVVQDLTGYTFAAQVRTVTGTLVASFVCSVVDAPNGKFMFSLPAISVGLLTTGVQYPWSLEFTVGGATYELYRGLVSTVEEITQP